MGLLTASKHHLAFHKLKGRFANYWKVFSQYREEILNASNEAIYFADLVKKRILYHYFSLQINKELAKIQDRTSTKKYKALVNSNETYVGEKHGIYCSIGSIARLMGKCKTTAWKYVNNMKENGILKVQKNSRKICPIREWNGELNEQYRNRTFSHKGFMCERLLNSYAF